MTLIVLSYTDALIHSPFYLKMKKKYIVYKTLYDQTLYSFVFTKKKKSNINKTAKPYIHFG